MLQDLSADMTNPNVVIPQIVPIVMDTVNPSVNTVTAQQEPVIAPAATDTSLVAPSDGVTGPQVNNNNNDIPDISVRTDNNGESPDICNFNGGGKYILTASDGVMYGSPLPDRTKMCEFSHGKEYTLSAMVGDIIAEF